MIVESCTLNFPFSIFEILLLSRLHFEATFQLKNCSGRHTCCSTKRKPCHKGVHCPFLPSPQKNRCCPLCTPTSWKMCTTRSNWWAFPFPIPYSPLPVRNTGGKFPPKTWQTIPERPCALSPTSLPGKRFPPGTKRLWSSAPFSTAGESLSIPFTFPRASVNTPCGAKACTSSKGNVWWNTAAPLWKCTAASLCRWKRIHGVCDLRSNVCYKKLKKMV